VQPLFQRNYGEKRMFYMWINVMFNRKDEKRVKEVGPDRAAAEWILRNGGSVTFAGFEKPIQDYNILPMGPKTNNYYLEVINARNISLTDNGLEHLVGLRHLKVIDMNSCIYITNLMLLREVANSLEYLDVGNCERLSDISPLADMQKLRKLILTNTLGKNRETVIADLAKKLPDCEIVD